MAIFLNGSVMAESAARISVFDHGLTVGDGVFETVKVAGGAPFALTRHLRRLRRSAAALGLPAPDLEAISAGAY
ncbi:MAG: aminotransferase class IV, partial [Streptosporangiaceae bacterium]